MLEYLVPIILLLWLTGLAAAVGLCRSAARGDREMVAAMLAEPEQLKLPLDATVAEPEPEPHELRLAA